MLERYTALLEDYGTLQNDYVSEREIRRSYQNSADQLKHEVEEVRHKLVRCLF